MKSELEVLFLEKREFKAKNGDSLVELVLLTCPRGPLIRKIMSLIDFELLGLPVCFSPTNSKSVKLILSDNAFTKSIDGWEPGIDFAIDKDKKTS